MTLPECSYPHVSVFGISANEPITDEQITYNITIPFDSLTEEEKNILKTMFRSDVFKNIVGDSYENIHTIQLINRTPPTNIRSYERTISIYHLNLLTKNSTTPFLMKLYHISHDNYSRAFSVEYILTSGMRFVENKTIAYVNLYRQTLDEIYRQTFGEDIQWNDEIGWYVLPPHNNNNNNNDNNNNTDNSMEEEIMMDSEGNMMW